MTSRRSMGLESIVFEDEMRGTIQVTLGAVDNAPITGCCRTSVDSVAASSTASAIEGTLFTDGSATLVLENLKLQTADLATSVYSCLRRGGGYVDLIGSNISTDESCVVRAYLMVAYSSV